MKKRFLIPLILVAALIGAFFLLRTPDTDPDAMLAKYGGEDAKFTVTPDGGESQHFQRGDLITFPQGMQCTWEITEDVEKHYDFQ